LHSNKAQASFINLIDLVVEDCDAQEKKYLWLIFGTPASSMISLLG